MAVADPARVQEARKVFFDGHGLPVEQINHAILRSWIRCADMGLNAHAVPNADAPTASEIRQLHEKYEALSRLCRPELDALYAEARTVSGIVVLTNAHGEVLDAVGDPSFAGKAAEVALRPGAQWSEDGTGTNAIGTALAERRAVVVNGAEHYFQAHSILSCAATPITDPRGATIGVLDISTPSSTPAGLMLGMVRMAVEQIEHRMFRGGFEGCQTLRFQADRNMLGAAREGILVFRDDRLVAANRWGLSLVNSGWQVLDQMRFSDLFDADMHGFRNGRLMGADGREFHAQFDGDAPSPRPLRRDPESLEDIELTSIRKALDAHGGNVSAAARRLGIHRSTIYRRMKEVAAQG